VNDTSAKRPVWNQKMIINIPEHLSEIVINVEVISLNWMSEDKTIGCASIDATNIADGCLISSQYDLEEPRVPTYQGKVKYVGKISLTLQYEKVEREAAPVGEGQVLYTADGRPMLVDSLGRVQGLYSTPGQALLQQDQQQQQQPQGAPNAISPEQISEIKKMFPDFSGEVIEAVLQEAPSAEAAIESILSMS